MDSPRSIGILGGGSAGYLAALALRKQLPHLDVTLIESSRIPIIGVGEATTPTMVALLHGYLGLDVAEFYRAVKPTWKLGVRLFWGPPGPTSFNFPFDAKYPIESYAYRGDINSSSLGSLLMTANLGPILMRGDWTYESLLRFIPFAYHLDNRRFVEYLQDKADGAGVMRIDAQIEDVEVAEGGTVGALVADDGRRFAFDLYLDCSGFRSRLLGQALGSPFVSYEKSLFTDTAIVADIPREGAFGSFTGAESMDHGWCWDIPELDAAHRGYVFSSAFASLDEAEAEMRRKNPGMGEARTVSFRSGRREHWWKGNVVGIGNAYGFVEPLESTALHMVATEIANVVGNLRRGPVHGAKQAQLNASIGGCWNYICGHLALHFKFNRKLDTEFWRACRSDVELRGVDDMVARALAQGPNVGRRGQHAEGEAYALDNVADETELLLLGQNVIARDVIIPRESREAFEARMAELEAHRRRALSSRASLAACLESPTLGDMATALWYQALLRSLEEPVTVRSARY